jgi:DHA1 family bicyclomycin/chloramphenicol resistance-like MFS transporter
MKIVAAITLSIAAFYVSTDIFTPSLPTIAFEFGVSQDIVQKTITYFLIGSIFSCLLSGFLADRYGKKRILLIGLGVALIGSVLATFSFSINHLLYARILQGIGGVTASVIGLSIVHDYASEKKSTKLFGTMGIYFAVIPALAPVFGGFLNDHWGWKSNFYVLLVFFIFSFLAVFAAIPSDKMSLRRRRNDVSWKAYLSMLGSRPFMFVIFLSPLFVSGEWFMISALPFYFQETLAYTPELYGLFLGSFMPWYACGSFLGGRYGQSFGLNNLIYAALSLGISGAFILILTAVYKPFSSLCIYAGFSLYLLAFGILFPTTATKTLGFSKELKATAGSFRTLFSIVFAFLGARFAEFADDKELFHLAAYFCLFSIFALVLFYFRGKEPCETLGTST